MVMALGVGAWTAAMFHLFTHAFFKACLFLGSGSVAHSVHSFDMKSDMGGLRKVMPQTFRTFIIGSIALAGLPPFAGFFSKDIILEAAWGSHTFLGSIAFYLGLIAALMTAFYSWRIIFLVFHVKSKNTYENVHESPLTMLIPIILLSLGAVFSGWIGYDMVSTTKDFWLGAIKVLKGHDALINAHHVPLLVKLSPILVASLGIFFAWLCYIKYPNCLLYTSPSPRDRG